MQERQIRATYDEQTITIYQAFNSEIAERAVKNNTFVYPFKVNRMTWVKPSFFWMMYRSGWTSKHNQEHILAIKITKKSFDTALNNACLSSFKPLYFKNLEEWEEIKSKSRVTIQWDPERDIFLNKLNYRSIQIGLSKDIVANYINDWIVEINDITQDVLNIKGLINLGQIDAAQKLIPQERIYHPNISEPRKIGLI